MKAFLDTFLPRLIPDWKKEQDFLCVPHRGKTDLDKSIRTKLKAWREPGVRFVVVRDNDNADCRVQKTSLQAICAQSGRPDTLIRLVCQELESWYLGDPFALAKAYPDAFLKTGNLDKRYCQPDEWQKPSLELERILPQFQKQDGARRLSAHLDLKKNSSYSFQTFVSGVRCLATQASLP